MLKINFSVAINDIKKNTYYDGNKHVHHFYEIRKDLVPPPNVDIKLIASEYHDTGSADFLFYCTATPYPEEEDHRYEELAEAPVTDEVNAGSLVSNPQEDYMMCVRLCDFSQQLQNLGVEIKKGEFINGDTIKQAINNCKDVKYACSCPGFYWTGIDYYVTQEGASLMPCTIEPTVWKKYREGALCCKHLSGLFRTISFFIPQMAMSIRKTIQNS